MFYEKVKLAAIARKKISGRNRSPVREIGKYLTLSSAIRLNEKRMQENADHISPLQSWGPELRNFRKLHRRPIIHGDCEIVIEKPTFIMKIDASKF